MTVGGRADRDLPWYFGWEGGGGHAAAETALGGPAGLRSSLGGQVAALSASALPDALRRAVARGEVPPGRMHAPPALGVVDSDAVEDATLRRIFTSRSIAEVEDRLAQVPSAYVHVLRLHYGTRSVAMGISGAAVLCPLAARLCRPHPVTRERLSEALREAVRRARGASEPLAAEVGVLVAEATAAYERTVVSVGGRMAWESDRERARRMGGG